MNKIISWITGWIETILIHCDKETMRSILDTEDAELFSHEEIMKMFEEG